MFSTFFFSKNVKKTGFYFKTHHDGLYFTPNLKPDTLPTLFHIYTHYDIVYPQIL